MEMLLVFTQAVYKLKMCEHERITAAHSVFRQSDSTLNNFSISAHTYDICIPNVHILKTFLS